METRREFCFDLLKDHQAVIVLERAGQEPPADGDGVRVRAEIHLPALRGFLLGDIQFDARVHVGGKNLGCYWGDSRVDYRYLSSFHAASTWRGAFAAAEEWARTELQPLLDALRTRRYALLDAEEGEGS